MRVFALFVFIFFAESMYCSSFDAYVDKTEIAAGETIRLTLEYLGQSNEEPDVSELQKNFTIVSRQTSSSSTFINGNFSAKTSWHFEVFPKSTASKVTIPSIKLGSLRSLPITVSQTAKGEAKEQTEGLSLDVKVDKSAVYVHAELILRIRIKTALPLRNGTLTKPEINDAIVEPLVEDGQSETIEGGIKYQIFDRSYAVFPSKPGKLQIPVLVFRGTILKERNGRAFPGFFSRSRQVYAHSNEITIDVLDVPESFPKDHSFLPVKNLSISDSFDKGEERFEVNKLITRRLMLKAQGSLASFLPTIDPPHVKNMQIYYETGSKVDRRLDGGVEASSQFSHVYMPTAPGEIKIPAQTIYWWNTETHQLETTEIQAIQAEVLGDAVVVKPEIPKPLLEKEKPVASEWLPIDNRYLIIVSVSGGVLLLYLLLLIIKIKKHKNNPENLSFTQQLNIKIKNIIKDCDESNAKLVYHELHSLRLWLELNQNPRLFNDSLSALMGELEQKLFRESKTEDFLETFKQIKKSLQNIKIKEKKGVILKPLYPH